MDKKIVNVPVGVVGKNWNGSPQYDKIEVDFDDSVENIIKMLENYQTQYSDYTNLRVIKEPARYSEDYEYFLYGSREENDIEYEYRITQEAKMRISKEERDRAEYERLRKKFESNNRVR